MTIIHHPDASDWRGSVIYQIYPRSFADSDGDGVGDLPGITARLDHVARLGADAIWLSPFFASPMKDFGYDVSDYRAVDPMFGTLSDFDALVARAHALGLKVLIDQVYCHTSDQHAWFSESRASRENAKADWYVWADAKPDGSPPNNWQSVFGGPAWTWDARRGQFYLHNFLTSQPQLNGHSADVLAELADTARFWLDRGVDGFRVDALNFLMHDRDLTDNPPEEPSLTQRARTFDFQKHIHNQSQPEIMPFIEQLRSIADAAGGRHLLAEIGGAQAAAEMQAYTHGPHRFNSAYGFDFLYAEALTPTLVEQACLTWEDKPQSGWPTWAFSNHDAPRWISRWAAPQDRQAFARMAMLLFACLRGNIIVWQGEELGITQVDIPFERIRDPEALINWPMTLGRDGTRTPMVWEADTLGHGFTSGEPWLPFGDDHPALAVDRQEADPASLLHFTRAVIAFRKAHPALKIGSIRFVEVGEALLVLEREEGDDLLRCAFNLGQEPVTLEASDGWERLLSVNGGGPALLPPFGAFITRRT